MIRAVAALAVFAALLTGPSVSTTTTELYMVGDSITEGYGVYPAYDRSYAHVTEDRVLGADHSRAQTIGHPGQCLVRTDCTGTRLLDTWLPEVVHATPTPTTVVVEIGTNDLGNGSSAADLEAALTQLVAAAPGIRVIVGTVPPRGVLPSWESQRLAVNAWIRSTFGADVADFEPDLAAPDGTMWPFLDSGDHIHPNQRGHLLMGYDVPLGRVL